MLADMIIEPGPRSRRRAAPTTRPARRRPSYSARASCVSERQCPPSLLDFRPRHITSPSAQCAPLPRRAQFRAGGGGVRGGAAACFNASSSSAAAPIAPLRRPPPASIGRGANRAPSPSGRGRLPGAPFFFFFFFKNFSKPGGRIFVVMARMRSCGGCGKCSGGADGCKGIYSLYKSLFVVTH